MVTARPKPGESVWLWLAKLATGVLVIVLLFVHLIVNHLVVQGGLMTYADVIQYLSNPWIAFMETCFLVIVVSHSLRGLRSIILDLNPIGNVLRVIDVLMVTFGIAAIVYGIVLMRLVIAHGVGG
jgi:succinate dehydrogenase hydrophobic anchor subunit